MKALILAGGYGTRLRPLSCTRPKLLFPVGNKPLIDLTFERLAKNGVKEVVLAVNFMADALKHACGRSKHGMKLHYSKDKPSKPSRASETKSLGTGGPIKQAEKILGSKEPFFVLNGDILTNVNYSEIAEEHKKNGGTATIALHEVEDPTRYGVVKLTEKNLITKFVEKPLGKAPSNLANAGIYIFEPDVFSYIPSGKHCSIEREVFPLLAKEGTLFGHQIEGCWIDVGKPADYLKANRMWLEAEDTTTCSPAKAGIRRSQLVRGRVLEATCLGENVNVGEKSIIGPNVSLGNEVSVGKKVRIRNSIVFSHTHISDFASVNGAIIGASVTIGKNVQINDGCLIGDNAAIHDNITLAENVKVCPLKEISKSIFTPNWVG